MAAPTVRGVGTVAAAATAVSPGLPTGTVAGDLLIMFIECRGEESAGASGWTQVMAPSNTGTTTGGTKLTALYKIAAGADSTTTNDSGDHQLARIIGIQAGTYNASNPFDTNTGTGTDATSSTAVTIPSITTQFDNELVVLSLSGNLPDGNSTTQFSGWTNVNLASLTEQIDNTTNAGDGGALGVATGVKASAGATNTTSVNTVTWATRAKLVFGIRPSEYTYTGLLGVVNAVGFAGTAQALTEVIRTATGQLGEARLEGFSGTVETVAGPAQYTIVVALGEARIEGFSASAGQEKTGIQSLGESNLEGYISSVSIERTSSIDVGYIETHGFSGSVERLGPIDISAQVGEWNVAGFAPNVLIETFVEVRRDEGAGSGRFSFLDHIAEEDKVILSVIMEFLKVA